MQVSLKSLYTKTIVGLMLLTSTNNTCFGAAIADDAILDPKATVVLSDLSNVKLPSPRYAQATKDTLVFYPIPQKLSVASRRYADCAIAQHMVPDKLAPLKNNKVRELRAAIAAGNNAIALEIITSKPAIVNYIDRDGRNALHLAAINNNAELIPIIATHISDINAQDTSGMPALHLACKTCHDHVVEALLYAGASIHAPATKLRIKPLAIALQTEAKKVRIGKKICVNASIDEADKDAIVDEVIAARRIIDLIMTKRLARLALK